MDDDDEPDEVVPEDYWPPPSLMPSHSTDLNTLNGINPNGTWSLWVVDDQPLAGFELSGGWCVELTVTGDPPACLTPSVVGTEASDRLAGTEGPDSSSGSAAMT